MQAEREPIATSAIVAEARRTGRLAASQRSSARAVIVIRRRGGGGAPARSLARSVPSKASAATRAASFTWPKPRTVSGSSASATAVSMVSGESAAKISSISVS